MILRIIVSLSILLIVTSCNSQKKNILPAKENKISVEFHKISKKIDECDVKSGVRRRGSRFAADHNIRLKLSEFKEIGFIIESDTLFFLMDYDGIVTHIFYGKIWDNKGNRVAFEYNRGKFELRDEMFEYFMLDLITEWDVDGIRNAESQCSVTSPSSITGSRVIRTETGYQVDCIRFDDFFCPPSWFRGNSNQ